jgi:hypothetical protein
MRGRNRSTGCYYGGRKERCRPWPPSSNPSTPPDAGTERPRIRRQPFVLVNESTAAFNELVAYICSEHQPRTRLESEICVAIAHAHSRLRRLWITECGLYDNQIDTRGGAAPDPVDESMTIAGAFERIAGENQALNCSRATSTGFYRTIDRLQERLWPAGSKPRRNKNILEEGTGFYAAIGVAKATYPASLRTTSPWTSVNRKSRPWNR